MHRAHEVVLVGVFRLGGSAVNMIGVGRLLATPSFRHGTLDSE